MSRKKMSVRLKKTPLFIILGVLVAGVALVGYRALIPEPREETVNIYLTRAGEEKINVFPVSRTIPPPETLETRVATTLNLLLEGPGAEEQAAGYSHELPTDTVLRGVRITRNGIAFLDFSQEIEAGGGTATMLARLKQIVYTATQFPQVKKVRILIDGREIPYFSGEGLTVVENPFGPKDLEW